MEVQTTDGRITGVRTGRNWVRVGDRVKARASGRKQAFETVVLLFTQDHDGSIVVDVTDPRTGNIRVVPFDRIDRLAQTKAGEKVGRRR